MKKIITILTMAAVATICCNAQDARTWRQGRLTWDDIPSVGAPLEDSISFKVSAVMQKTVKAVKANRTTYKYTDVEAILDKPSSWVYKKGVTTDDLKRAQGIFDMVEYNARGMRDSLLSSEADPKDIEWEYMKRINKFLREYGPDTDLSKYALEADDFDITKTRLEFSPTAFAFHASAIATAPFGALAKLTTPAIGVELGADVDWGRKGALMFDASAAYGKFIADYADLSGIGKTGTLIPVYRASLKYACPVLKTRDLALSLFAGPEYIFRQFRSSQQPVINLSGIQLSEGICADFRIWGAYSLWKQHPASTDTFVRVRLSCDEFWNTRTQTISPAATLSIGFGFKTRKITKAYAD